MKKLLFIGIMFVSGILKAQDLVTATLIENVMPVTQFRSAETKLALMDSVIQVGKIENCSVLDLQFGFNGETNPRQGEVSSANFIGGAFFKVSSIINPYVNFPLHWDFLRNLQHGPFVQYDWREKDWYGGYQMGLNFELKPKN